MRLGVMVVIVYEPAAQLQYGGDSLPMPPFPAQRRTPWFQQPIA
jgi:hypothetical protein